ncbi:MAG: helix-turn-helix transcriptional regulator [Sinimarinibacterium flocculans]|uniref:AraC family transcriptional regulator n=1 Tax=Sinimarinibacterium flocculans TaxID=985250 RepID=UPI003C4BF1AC
MDITGMNDTLLLGREGATLGWPVFDGEAAGHCDEDERDGRVRARRTGSGPSSVPVDPGGGSCGTIEERAIGSCSVLRVRSRVRNTFRRDWTEVRDDGVDVATLCFVRRGLLRLTQAGGVRRVAAGELVVTVSTMPFEIDVSPGPGGEVELLQLAVPTHVLRGVSNREVRAGTLVPAGDRRVCAAMQILAVLGGSSSDIPDAAAAQMLEALLPLLGSAVGTHAVIDTPPRLLADRRLLDVLRYVETHLSDPRLSTASVARNCGISSRYLSALLRRRGATFLSLVRSKRLETAGRWLATSSPAQASVSEIAYRVGFKSPAHFSRVFRRTYQMSPTAYRERSSAARTLQSGATHLP